MAESLSWSVVDSMRCRVGLVRAGTPGDDFLGGLRQGLSVNAQHHRAFRRVQVQPDDVDLLGSKAASPDSLNVDTSSGLKFRAFQIRATMSLLTP